LFLEFDLIDSLTAAGHACWTIHWPTLALARAKVDSIEFAPEANHGKSMETQRTIKFWIDALMGGRQ
jgi:hypothetical protein